MARGRWRDGGRIGGREGFFARVTKAEEADGGNEEEAGFDEEFAAVGPSYGRIFQVGIGEEAMPKKGSGLRSKWRNGKTSKIAAKTKAT